jgi:macrolide transport system ATP-binding/permease protein
VRLEPGSAIVVDGRAVEVAGVIDDSSRIPELVGAVVLIGGDETLQGMLRRVALVTTSSGAAQQVAGQLAVAIDPIAPTSVEVFAPVDPSTLRAEVEADVLVTLGAFSGVAVLASILALANSMMMTVLERQAELGLRRAVGARRRHVSLLILTESAALGAVGGGLGLFAGLLAIIGITLANRWAPVFDPAIAPLALLGGVVVGALGGGAAAVRASRIQPGQALRL